MKDDFNKVTELMSVKDFKSLAKIAEEELNNDFNILETKIFIDNEEYKSISEKFNLQNRLLNKETKYLYDEGILNWVKTSGTTQVVPSPFYSYGKSAIIISPIKYNKKNIGYYLALSKNNRLKFNDEKVAQINNYLKLFSIKLIAMLNEYKLEKYKENYDELEKLIIDNVDLLNSKIAIKNISENINKNLDNIKSNIDLLDENSDLFFTRLNKINNELDDILKLNNNISANLESDVLKEVKGFELREMIENTLDIMELEIQRSDIELNFVPPSDKLDIDLSNSKFRYALINLLLYLLKSPINYKNLIIYCKKTNSNIKISFFLGVESFSTQQNAILEEPITKLDIPKELEITRILLNNMNVNFDILYTEELGYFYNIII